MAEMLEPATLDETEVRETWDVADERTDEAEEEGGTAPREPVDEDRKGYELIDGTWVEKPEMGAKSSKVLTRLIGHVQQHVDQHALGDVFESECGYHLISAQPKLVRKPDVSFVAAGRFPNNAAPLGNIKLAPDLAAEVASPNDGAAELERKIDEYLRAGVRLVWVVHPNTKVVYVYRPDGTAARKTLTDSLDGESVLPGFALRLDVLFKGL